MIVKITPYDNGAHANQSTVPLEIPDGWAVVLPDIEIPKTFPFVDIEVDGDVVTAMTPGVVPEPDPQQHPDKAPTIEQRVAALEAASAQQDEAIIGLYEAAMQ